MAQVMVTGEAVGGQLATSGTVVVDFGTAFSDFVSVFVAQPAMPAGVHVRAWLMGHTMTSNGVEDHRLLGLFSKIVAYNVTESVGFTIDVFCYIGLASGRYRIDWAY